MQAKGVPGSSLERVGDGTSAQAGCVVVEMGGSCCDSGIVSCRICVLQKAVEPIHCQVPTQMPCFPAEEVCELYVSGVEERAEFEEHVDKVDQLLEREGFSGWR